MNLDALRAAERLFQSLPVTTHTRGNDPRLIAEQRTKKAEDNKRYREKKLGIAREKKQRGVHGRRSISIAGNTYGSCHEARKVKKIGSATLYKWLADGRARYV